MEEIANAVISQGIALNKADSTQLSQAMNSIAGKKRNLNFNPAFYVQAKWGGVSSVTTPVTLTKLLPVGWNIGADSTISAPDLVITADTNGLNISGTADSSGGTIVVYQTHSKLQDATFGNDIQTTAGEVKKFTSSIKYKKVSGSNFTIQSYIGSIAGDETIILDETKTTSSDGDVNTAYRHAQVNTKDLVTTPITGCGFKITLASSGAFDIQLKNCDMTEGFTIPDFQTYGDYTADNAFAVSTYGADTLSGKFNGNVAILRASGSDAFTVLDTIPIPSQKILSTDTVNITSESITLYDSVTGAPLSTSGFTAGADKSDGRIDLLGAGTLSSSAGVSYIAQLSYDWEWIAS